MRIVAGELRGRSIAAPDGSDTRPTTDRVREALFSSLYSLRGGFEDAVVLDAFAGSGALGIEALSRGAARALLCDTSEAAVRAIRKNLAGCGLGPDRASVVRRDAMAQPPTSAQGTFDLVFLDPPYAYEPERVTGMLLAMRASGSLADGAIIVYEHALKAASEVTDALEAADFDVRASRKYGKTGVTIALVRSLAGRM